jgi:hypothetical protein
MTSSEQYFRPRTSSTIHINNTEIREGRVKWGDDLLLPLKKYTELGRDKKIIVFCNMPTLFF